MKSHFSIPLNVASLVTLLLSVFNPFCENKKTHVLCAR